MFDDDTLNNRSWGAGDPLLATLRELSAALPARDFAGFCTALARARPECREHTDPALALVWEVAEAARQVAAARCASEGATQAERDRADAAVEGMSDIEDELAEVTATSLPGLVVQLKSLWSLVAHDSGLEGRLAQQVCRGALDPVFRPHGPAGSWETPPATVAALGSQLRLFAELQRASAQEASGWHDLIARRDRARLEEEELEDLIDVRLSRRIIAGAEALAAAVAG